MLLLTSTSDVIRVVTATGVTVDVHASWVDRNGSTDTPGSTNTAISTATTTTVVAAPAASTARNVRALLIRNRHATTAETVTVELYNGSTAYQLDKRVILAGQSLMFDDAQGFRLSPVSPVTPSEPWHGVVAAAFGNGNPATMWQHMITGGTAGATPTNISTSVARCSSFVLPAGMTVNRLRVYGIGSTTNVYRVALYRYSDLARLMAETAFSTSANTWTSIGSALNVSLSANTRYFVALSVNATGTTAGCMSWHTTTTSTNGQINTAPGSLPGSLALTSNYLQGATFQFAVTTGALPDPAAALAAPAAWTGGMAAIWLDSADT
jgi:hypothetical protein